MKYIIATLLFVGFGLLMFMTAEAHEKQECMKWQEQADTGYVDYYITDWQFEQCQSHNIELTI